ncbi:hypothetical protein BpHYR1_043886 [Brachionus plicatilis]|uniref:Uncharacterized protein n=1 Tax=Brachionus plicatilis TaxID=10195 RepID=A0A3M7T7J9_BRAPC|nr:hypothetical protein BpHYR1_043886 [Brachionus plicatilis]
MFYTASIEKESQMLNHILIKELFQFHLDLVAQTCIFTYGKIPKNLMNSIGDPKFAYDIEMYTVFFGRRLIINLLSQCQHEFYLSYQYKPYQTKYSKLIKQYLNHYTNKRPQQTDLPGFLPCDPSLLANCAENKTFDNKYYNIIGYAVEQISDPVRRKAIETMIKTWCQTPKQLFTTKHPGVSRQAIAVRKINGAI